MILQVDTERAALTLGHRSQAAIFTDTRAVRVDVSLVVPMYNESGSIGQVVTELQQHASRLAISFEVVVVDDGSSDGGGEIAIARGARLIRHRQRRGNGRAIRDGILASSGDVVVVVDGDGQHDPSYLSAMIASLANADIVIGARRPDNHASIGRRIGNALLNSIASYAASFAIRDLTSGYRCFRRTTIIPFLALLPNGFSWATTTTIACALSGLDVEYLPMTMRSRKGRSKVRPLRDGMRFLFMILRTLVMFVPMRFFAPLSLVCCAFGIAHATLKIVVFGLRYTEMSIACILIGVVMFLIGLVAEQLAAMRLDRSKYELLEILRDPRHDRHFSAANQDVANSTRACDEINSAQVR